MSVESHTSSLPDLLRDRNWLESYKRILLNIIYFGLFLFIGGIYIFPNDSGTQQSFYLLIVLPFLFLFPFIIKELPWRNRFLYLFMAFPLYMFISHFWAPIENVTRDWFFFFKQWICFLLFLLSVFVVLKAKNKFISDVMYYLLVVGFVSGVVSLFQHLCIEKNTLAVPIKGFSIVDIDKVGAIHSIHVGFCFAALSASLAKLKNRRLWSMFLVLAIIIDFIIIFLTQALGGWVIIIAAALMCVLAIFQDNLLGFILVGVSLLILGLILFYQDIIEWYNVDYNYNVRVRIKSVVSVIHQWHEHKLVGVGLTYKLPLPIVDSEKILIHPHNMVTDTLRFGGLVGFLLLGLHVSVAVIKNFSSTLAFVENRFLMVWLVCGLLASTLYGQQPYVRPGSYMWVFYWIPVTLIYAKIITRSKKN